MVVAVTDSSLVTKSAQLQQGNSKEEKVLKNLNQFVTSNLLSKLHEDKVADPLFGGGFAEELLQSFLHEEYAQRVTEKDELKLNELFKNAIPKQSSTDEKIRNTKEMGNDSANSSNPLLHLHELDQ